jgi:transposase-like protein
MKKPTEKHISHVCPECGSTYNLFRRRTQDYLCRRCGTSFKADDAQMIDSSIDKADAT